MCYTHIQIIICVFFHLILLRNLGWNEHWFFFLAGHSDIGVLSIKRTNLLNKIVQFLLARTSISLHSSLIMLTVSVNRYPYYVYEIVSAYSFRRGHSERFHRYGFLLSVSLSDLT